MGCKIRCLREELDDHQNQSQRYHLDLTLATIKTLKDELKHNNIRCKNAHDGCDWRGKSTEEHEAHTAVCPKQGVQCPFDEEFRCRDAYFRREELNAHLQYHITSLHTQFKTCQCETPPLTFIIPEFRSSVVHLHCRGDSDILKEYKFPFYTCQGGYLMRLCISVKSFKYENCYIELSVESMPGSYDDRLPYKGRVRIKGRMFNSNAEELAQSFEVSADVSPRNQQSPTKCVLPRNFELDDFFSQYDHATDAFIVEIHGT